MKRRLPVLAAYVAAHAGKTLFWVISDVYFTWIVVKVGGLAPELAGLGVGLSILLAALADWLGGRWLGWLVVVPVQAARGQFHATVVTGLALLLFAGVGLGGTTAAVPMLALLILFRLSYAALDITQNALPALLACDDARRTQFIMWRNIAGGGARIAMTAGFVPLMLHHSAQQQATRFLLLAAVVVTCAIVAAAALRSTVAPGPILMARDETAVRPPALRLIAAMTVASLGMTLFQQLEPFFLARSVAWNSAGNAVATAFMTAGALGSVASQPGWRMLFIRDGMRRWLRGAIGAACLLCAALLSGIVLPHGPLANVFWAGSVGLAYGIGSGGLLLWLWSGISDCHPVRALGQISRFSAGAKLGQAVGIALVGGLLHMSAGGLAAGGAMIAGLLLMILAVFVA